MSKNKAIDIAQKNVQREIWKLGSQKILRDGKKYLSAAWLLEHSLQNAPEDVYRDQNSRIAQVIADSNEMNKFVDDLILGSSYGYFAKTSSLTLGSGELFYAFNIVEVSILGVMQDDGSWNIGGIVTDTYDFTEIKSMMNAGDYSFNARFGTLANDGAVISQALDAINPYKITVSFGMKR